MVMVLAPDKKAQLALAKAAKEAQRGERIERITDRVSNTPDAAPVDSTEQPQTSERRRGLSPYTAAPIQTLHVNCLRCRSQFAASTSLNEEERVSSCPR